MNRLLVCLLLLISGSTLAHERGHGHGVSMADLARLAGDGWSGSLTYLNYGSDERSTIPVNLQVRTPKGRTMAYAIQYPGEEAYNSKEKLELSRDGGELNGDAITDRLETADGALVIRTLGRGEDDDRPADIEFVYSIDDERFSITKNVRFEGTKDWIKRNEYVFTR